MPLSLVLVSDEVIDYENNGGYNPMDIYNNDPEIRAGADTAGRWILIHTEDPEIVHVKSTTHC